MGFAEFIIFLCEELHIIDENNVIYLFCKTFLEHDWGDFDLVSSFAQWIINTITDKINFYVQSVYILCFNWVSNSKEMILSMGQSFFSAVDFTASKGFDFTLENFVYFFVGMIIFVFIFKLVFKLICTVVQTIFSFL